MYKFINTKGEHLHELDGKPLIGTSTVLNVLAKPLTWWAAGLAVKELGWLNPKESSDTERINSANDSRLKIANSTDEEYLKLLDKAYRAHSVKLDKSAEEGTDMHEELEKYIKSCIETNSGIPLAHSVGEIVQVSIFVDWALANIKRFIVSEGYCYSTRLWVGGIVDVLAELKDGQIGIIDFKSSKDVYFSQFLQCSGYAIEISENGLFDKEGNELYKLEGPISFYAVFPFGAKKVEPQFNYDVEAVKKGFESCVQLYKLINKLN